MLNEFDLMRDVAGKFEKAGIPYMLTELRAQLCFERMFE